MILILWIFDNEINGDSQDINTYKQAVKENKTFSE